MDISWPVDIQCQHPARPLPHLQAQFALRSGLFRRELVSVPVFRITDRQCIIKTDKTFEPGDRLTLELTLDLPFENLVVPDLAGIVVASEKYCSNYFLTVRFPHLQDQTLAEAIPGMQRMIDLLNRMLALEQRRTPGNSSIASSQTGSGPQLDWTQPI